MLATDKIMGHQKCLRNDEKSETKTRHYIVTGHQLNKIEGKLIIVCFINSKMIFN
jgi:hypothetical protein